MISVDFTVDFSCLKADIACRQNECVQVEFQVDGAETENAREEKLPVIPNGLARRFVLEESKDRDGR